MTQREAIGMAKDFLAAALQENELSDRLYEQGDEDESNRQADLSVTHSNLAIALMLTHGVMYTTNQ